MALVFHTVLTFVMLGTFTLLLYQQIVGNNVREKIYWLFGTAIIFSVYMTIAQMLIPEPIRAMLGILILGYSLWLWQKATLWAALVLAFVSGYAAWIGSISLSTIFILLLFGDTQHIAEPFIMLLVQFGFYFTLYKFSPFKRGFPIIKLVEVKAIIFQVTGIILAIFGWYHITATRFDEVSPMTLRLSLAALGIAIVTLVFFTIVSTIRVREKLHADKKQKLLVSENRDLMRLQHKYRDIVPALVALKDNERFTRLAEQLSMELSEELALDDLVDSYCGFALPDEWMLLKKQIVKVLKECEQKDYSAFAKNAAKTWEQVNIAQIKLMRLVGNLMKNAMRELDKTDTDYKRLEVSFFDNGGNFSVAVSDTAHEFPIEVLARLGQIGNSTNDSGFGYAEIIEFLFDSGASLVITERIEDEQSEKMVGVVFDGKARIIVQTAYRYDELKTALAGSGVEVERLA